MFAIMHKSVSDESKKMFEELRRNNYVTPSNFLELTAGYKTYTKISQKNNNKKFKLMFFIWNDYFSKITLRET